jgi:hypothetical protein
MTAMSNFNANLALLRRKNHALAEMLSGMCDSASITVENTAAGDAVPVVSREGKKLLIHSKFDPVKEAERFTGEVDPAEFDLIVVMGFGFAYHLQALLSRMNDDSVLLVIEHDSFMIRAALASRDLSSLLADPRLTIMVRPGEDDFGELLRGKSSKRVSFVTHRGSFQLDPEYYTSAAGIARSWLSTKEVNIATLAKFEKIWSANIARNIRRFIAAPDAGIFYGRFTGVPAIVVAAGPSLDTSIEFIARNRDRALIIAVDTAFGLLAKHGIDPHFCLAVDPQAVNARYFEGAGPSNAVLVADPTVHPAVFRFFRGRSAVTGIAFEMMRWIETIAGTKAEISHGGSVSTNAYDFASRLGASPIIMVGQDLAFTGGYAHARGSYLDEQVHLRRTRVFTAEMFNRRQLTALPAIYVRGIGGGRVRTNQKMVIFMSWFEKRNDPSLINASAAGALIPGVRHCRADELDLAHAAADPAVAIAAIMGDAASEGDRAALHARFRDRLASMAAEVEALIPVLQRSVGFSQNLVGEMAAKNRNQGKVDYILAKLAEADRIVESRSAIKDMISFTVQRVIHTITEGYDIDEGDAGLPDEVRVAKRSHYLYKGLLDGALFNRKLFGKMAAALKN